MFALSDVILLTVAGMLLGAILAVSVVPRRRPMVEAAVQRLTLKPGDIIVVHIDFALSAEQIRHVRAVIREAIGEPERKVIVLGKEGRLSVLERAAEVPC